MPPVLLKLLDLHCDFDKTKELSWQVPGGGIAALPVLRSLHPGPEAEAFCVGELVPSNLC